MVSGAGSVSSETPCCAAGLSGPNTDFIASSQTSLYVRVCVPAISGFVCEGRLCCEFLQFNCYVNVIVNGDCQLQLCFCLPKAFASMPETAVGSVGGAQVDPP